MRVHDDYKEWNVAKQMKDTNSVWKFWQRMLALRKSHPALIYGEFVPLAPDSEEHYSYTRESNQEKILVVLNLAAGPDRGGKAITVDLAGLGVDTTGAKLLISNDDQANASTIQDGKITLDKWCGRVYLLEETRN